MTREIKFRAWVPTRKRMIFFWLFGTDEGYHIQEQEQLEECEIMQFTGLLDSKGTEIWEGDVVAVENEGDVITVCKWDSGCFVLEDNAGGHWTRQLFHQPYRLEIIGNIHENPELIQ